MTKQAKIEVGQKYVKNFPKPETVRIDSVCVNTISIKKQYWVEWWKKQDFLDAYTLTSLKPEQDKLSASEALYGFAGWLTTRDTTTVFGAKHEAGVAACLVGEFCEVNHLSDHSESWHRNLIHPSGECSHINNDYTHPADCDCVHCYRGDIKPDLKIKHQWMVEQFDGPEIWYRCIACGKCGRHADDHPVYEKGCKPMSDKERIAKLEAELAEALKFIGLTIKAAGGLSLACAEPINKETSRKLIDENLANIELAKAFLNKTDDHQ